MYIVKNAVKNITRAKGKTALIFVLVLVIAVSASVALCIKNSAEEAKETTYENMTVTGQIGIDRTSMMSGMEGDPDAMREGMEIMGETLSEEELEMYAESEYVTNFYYIASIALNSADDDFETYSTSSSSSMMPGMSESSTDVTITGYSSHDGMSEFIDGTLTISDGEVFDATDSSYTCVISEEIALLNDISVGDKIKLENPNDDSDTYKFEVVGIFSCESTDIYANDIYTSYASIESICENSEEEAGTYTDERTEKEVSAAISLRSEGYYVFDSPDSMEAFEEDIEDMGLDTSMYAVTSLDLIEFEESMEPLDNLSDYTMIFFIIVLIIGGIILVVFNLFTIRERKYEIGVLAAIGMPKSKVVMQFLCEVVIITFIAVIVGTGIGTAISSPVGDALLSSQLESIVDESASIDSNFGGNFGGTAPGQSAQGGMEAGGGGMMGGDFTSSTVDYVDSIETSISIVVLLQLMIIGVLLSVIASIVGIISILRYEPLKILSERA